MPPGMTADKPPHIPGMDGQMPPGMSPEMMEEMMSKMSSETNHIDFEPKDDNIQIEEVD